MFIQLNEVLYISKALFLSFEVGQVKFIVRFVLLTRALLERIILLAALLTMF